MTLASIAIPGDVAKKSKNKRKRREEAQKLAAGGDPTTAKAKQAKSGQAAGQAMGHQRTPAEQQAYLMQIHMVTCALCGSKSTDEAIGIASWDK